MSKGRKPAKRRNRGKGGHAVVEEEEFSGDPYKPRVGDRKRVKWSTGDEYHYYWDGANYKRCDP